MENQKNPKEADIDPVSRKTNEEIDTDDAGNLIIDGKYVDESAKSEAQSPKSEVRSPKIFDK